LHKAVKQSTGTRLLTTLLLSWPGTLAPKTKGRLLGDELYRIFAETSDPCTYSSTAIFSARSSSYLFFSIFLKRQHNHNLPLSRSFGRCTLSPDDHKRSPIFSQASELKKPTLDVQTGKGRKGVNALNGVQTEGQGCTCKLHNIHGEEGDIVVQGIGEQRG
jgi:hypothetical protein